jgi:hypothetical protein
MPPIRFQWEPRFATIHAYELRFTIHASDRAEERHVPASLIRPRHICHSDWPCAMGLLTDFY